MKEKSTTDKLKSLLKVLKRQKRLKAAFNIYSFVERGDRESFITTEEEAHNCGTAACVAGYAALSKEGKALGLDIHNDGRIIYKGKIYTIAQAMSQAYNIERNDAALLCFHDTAHHPFYGKFDHTPTIEEAIAGVESLIKRYTRLEER